MSFIKVKTNTSTDIAEFIKAANFVSPHITDIKTASFEDICFYFDDIVSPTEIDCISNELEKLIKKFNKSDIEDELFYKSNVDISEYFDAYEKNKNVFFFTDSQLGFGEKGIFLLNYFDSAFERFALNLGAVKKIYPVLLSVPEYLKTGYIKKSPQYAILCSSVKDSMSDVEKLNSSILDSNAKEKLKEPEFALSPSACFHTYIEYQNQTLDKNSVITFKQNVFRNEGRLNYKEKGRLMDYHVREIVFIGDEKFVEKQRLQLMKDSEVFMKEHQLEGDISLATDSFVLPKMQMYKTIQKIDKTKYEMHLNVEKNKNISVASFNLHGKAFTDPFNISVKDTDTVTGCVGFGLQRWVIAFVSQYGWDERNWPEKIKKAYVQKKDL